MKVDLLIVSPNFNPGGAERIAIKIANGMVGFGHNIHFCVINGIGPLKNELLSSVVIHDLKMNRVRYSAYGLIKLINSIHPDIVFSSTNRLNSMLLFSKPLLKNDIKIIIREPNTPSINLQSLSFPWIYRFVYKYLYKNADKVVAQSYYMLDDMVNNFSVPPSVIKHIYNPVDINGEAKEDVEPFSKEVNKVTFVSCGRLDNQKGFDLLLRAIAMLEDRIDMIFLIIGEGVWREMLEKLAVELKVDDCVTFLGYKNNTQNYFLSADVVISSSRWEGLPNVVLESVAIGTPVLATNCPGGTSEIIKTGVNGWLVDTEDVAALSMGIQQAANEYSGFEQDTVSRSVLNFSNEIIFEQYNNLFIGLANNND